MGRKFNFIRFLITLFLIFLIAVSIYQLYSFLYKSATTEYAVEITCEDTVKTTGYFLRNESIVESKDAKYIDMVVQNGGKVSKNGTIANVYTSEDAAKIQTQIRELQIRIDEFRSVISASSAYRDDASFVSDIKKEAINLSKSVSEDDAISAFENASAFVTNVTKEKISNGEIVDYADNLKQLEAEMAELKNRSSSIISYITSPKSGYFSYKVDGLENKLDMTMLESVDPEIFRNIQNICEETDVNTSGIGKVVEGSDWMVCFKSKSSKFEKTEVNDVLYIRIPSVTDSKIKCSVAQMHTDGDDIYVVLKSNVVTGDLLSERVCEIDIIIDSHTGLRVDKNALRKIDGENGVFVKTNGILKYRKVEILYIASTYAVIKYDAINSSGVQVYDEVVVKGHDLYDGKVVS